jgi:hypothetical protein
MKAKTVCCDHCNTEILEKHATKCESSEFDVHWHYCLACDLSFTIAAARNAGVRVEFTREQVLDMTFAIRKLMREEL